MDKRNAKLARVHGLAWHVKLLKLYVECSGIK